MKDKKILFITQTAVMLALLIGVQFATRPLGQFVTGSLVNLILLVSVFIAGLGSGLTVAAASPFLAFILGLPYPLPQIVPFISAGNAVLVVIAWLIRKHVGSLKHIGFAAAGLIAASAAKFLFLWLGIVKVLLPLVPSLPEQRVNIITAAFTWPQLVTALIGSSLALAIVPLVRNALGRDAQ
jgi:riboflavin transporter FmnP